MAGFLARSMLKSKLHRDSVTQADLAYEGSVTGDAHSVELAGPQRREVRV